MFCRIRRKIKQNDGRNQVKRELLINSNFLTMAKKFVTAKECFTTANRLRNTAASGLPGRRLLFAVAKRSATTKEKARCSEEQNEIKTSIGFATVKLSFAVVKRFTTTKTPFATTKKGSNRR